MRKKKTKKKREKMKKKHKKEKIRKTNVTAYWELREKRNIIRKKKRESSLPARQTDKTGPAI